VIITPDYRLGNQIYHNSIKPGIKKAVERDGFESIDVSLGVQPIYKEGEKPRASNIISIFGGKPRGELIRDEYRFIWTPNNAQGEDSERIAHRNSIYEHEGVFKELVYDQVGHYIENIERDFVGIEVNFDPEKRELNDDEINLLEQLRLGINGIAYLSTESDQEMFPEIDLDKILEDLH
jgi:hypothetical protein